MAQPSSATPKAEPGDILQGIHDFQARSADEISLHRGDQIELIERDDDFGDGWYLGKRLADGRTGLFPEVYTRPANRINKSLPSKTPQSAQSMPSQNLASPLSYAPSSNATNMGPPPLPAKDQATATPAVPSAYPVPSTSPLHMPTGNQRAVSAPATGLKVSPTSTHPPAQRSISVLMEKASNGDEDSPVMNETLSVIDEHITDMNTPRSSMLSPDLRTINDSGSEYSAYVDHRMSYINGNETDEEERATPTRQEVMRWSPRDVAEHLLELGVEKRHCDIFVEQEISGEVLLALDQATLFLKEFDLGPVGRRLKTWHKIKAFQEELAVGSDSVRQSSMGRPPQDRSSVRHGSGRSSMLPKIPPFSNGSTPSLPSSQEGSRAVSDHLRPTTTRDSSRGPSQLSNIESNIQPAAATTPKREHHHSRRHSSLDYKGRAADATSFSGLSKYSTPPTSPEAIHKKQPSIDRNWHMPGLGLSGHRETGSGTLGSIFSHRGGEQSMSDLLGDTTSTLSDRRASLDRGYASGDEADARRHRNVLRKNQPTSAGHSRQGSQQIADVRSSSISKRHSRFSSAGSVREAFASVKSSPIFSPTETFARARHRASGSISHTPESLPSASGTPPLVTRLDYGTSPNMPTTARTGSGSPWAPADVPTAGHSPLIAQRSQSDATAIEDKTLTNSPAPASQDDAGSPRPTSPTRNDSTALSEQTPSSLETEKTDLTMAPSSTMSNGGSRRGKSKRGTSAYQKGLMRVPPREAMQDCDYSGWMKKKSPKMTSTWKPRLFVLRGRRLGYYYSEDDQMEKGVIDISSHRVLPADKEFLTGLHATLTGAKSSPTSPANVQNTTMNASEMSMRRDGAFGTDANPGMFIFKLVPPRAGMARAISFTKQMVHYFAVDNVQQGRHWMAALMKATIDRDDTAPVSTSYTQKTITLSKAISMKQRPPALMANETTDEANRRRADTAVDETRTGLNISGVPLHGQGDQVESPNMTSATAANNTGNANGMASAPLPSTSASASASASAAEMTPSTLIGSSPDPDDDRHQENHETVSGMSSPRSLSSEQRRHPPMVTGPLDDYHRRPNSALHSEKGSDGTVSPPFTRTSSGKNLSNMSRSQSGKNLASLPRTVSGKNLASLPKSASGKNLVDLPKSASGKNLASLVRSDSSRDLAGTLGEIGGKKSRPSSGTKQQFGMSTMSSVLSN